MMRGCRRVSIHAPARVRPGDGDGKPRGILFQSTHPQGCDPAAMPRPPPRWCFNPRTRKGATSSCPRARHRRQFQSTHPQGCDVVRADTRRDLKVSIHAPARVRRQLKYQQLSGVGSFNPRTRKGATATRSGWTSTATGFNPRTRKGATTRESPVGVRRQVSIHAPARVRLFLFRNILAAERFQSTHPQGCDIGAAEAAITSAVSIHAPARVRLAYG